MWEGLGAEKGGKKCYNCKKKANKGLGYSSGVEHLPVQGEAPISSLLGGQSPPFLPNSMTISSPSPWLHEKAEPMPRSALAELAEV